MRPLQRDFFVADLVDVGLKDDMVSMEHPLFALRAGDRSVRRYAHNGHEVIVKPGHDGCATVHDKDIWIYCISQLVEALNRKRDDVSPRVRIVPYDLLRVTGRQTSGRGYRLLEDALNRLKGTVIQTTIQTGNVTQRSTFGLIEAWHSRRSDREAQGSIEVELPAWLWRTVKARLVLTLSPSYFDLRKSLDRRLYELARKHCGSQPRWFIGAELLQKKAGARGSKEQFLSAVRRLEREDILPDYRVALDRTSAVVCFSNRSRLAEPG
jgi:plasmid replication initiation protein